MSEDFYQNQFYLARYQMDDERRNTERLRYLLERWLFHFIDHLEVGDEVGNYLAKETRLVLYGIADESRDATR